MQNGGKLSPSPVSIARLGLRATQALEHDSKGNRNEFRLSSSGRNTIVTRFDEGLEARQRKVDTSAGVPAEVVLCLAGESWGCYGRHVEASAADEVRRQAG